MRVRTREANDGKVFTGVQIVRWDTKEKVLDIEDTLDCSTDKKGEFGFFEKAKFSLTEYSKDHSKPSTHLQHFMELDAFLLVAQDIATIVRKKDVSNAEKPYEYIEFKGKPDPSSPTGFTAKKLTIAFWPEGGRGAGAYTIQLEEAPGTANDTGAISFAPGHDKRAGKIILTIPEAREKFNMAAFYFQSKMTALLMKNWKRLYEVKEGTSTGE